MAEAIGTLIAGPAEAGRNVDLRVGPAVPRERAQARGSVRGRRRPHKRATTPVAHPVRGDVRDPLVRDDGGAPRRLGRGTVLLIAAAALHVLVLVGFVFGNTLMASLLASPEAEPEPTEVAVLDAPEPSEAPRPIEPDPEPLPSDPVDRASVPQEAVPAPPVGISADSTVEGGDGPAYQVGTSLAGATAAGTLTQEMIGGQKAATAAEDLVMTKDAVDALPTPAESNRPPEVSARARRDGVSGFVQVQFLITKSGAVEQLEVIKATPAGVFEQAVLDTVPSWRFTPATYKGQPVTMRIRQTIRFDVS